MDLLEEITMKLLKENEQIEEGKHVKLQEATVKDMYNQLDDTKGVDSVEGIIDDILVVTDPEVTSEEYDEVIERAQEIIEDTPEGEIPFDEEYIGQYLLTCPICGTTFVSEEMLEPGATCPACMEVPEGFTVKGQIQTEEDVAVDNGLKVDDDQATEEETTIEDTTDENNEQDSTDEEEPEKQTASKEIPQGNKLQETKLTEDKSDKVFTDFRFVNGYPQLDKFKDEALEYQDLSELYSFKTNRSGGTYSEDDTEQKLKDLRIKLTKEIYDYLVDNNTYIVTFDDSRQQLIIGKSKQDVDTLVNDYKINDAKDWDGYGVNSVDLFKDWFDRYDYVNIDRNPYRINVNVNVKMESKSIKTEDTYEEGIFYEIEEALRDAGLNPVRFTEDGVMTNNLGWTVTGEDGTQQQITCDGSYLTESKKQEDYWQDVKDGVCSNCHKKLDPDDTYIIDGRQVCGSCKTDIEQDKLDNEDTEPEKRIDDFNDYYESKDVKTEDSDNDRLPVEGDGIEVIVTENSVGYLLRGLIIDHNNKQFQYVQGPSLPLGKYRRVSKNTMRSTIEQLQNEEYTEYKGKDSIPLEENVQVAKFERYQVRKFVEDNNTKYGIYDLVERKFIQTDESIQKINEEYTKYKSE